MTKKTTLWVAGAAVAALAIAVPIAVIVLTQGGGGSPSAEPARTPLTVVTQGADLEPSAAVSSPAAEAGDGATAAGWVVEPTTTDASAYAEAAIRAVTTFDTRKATREQYIEYLKTWMTTWVNDTPGKELNPAQTESYVGKLDRDVLPPADLWAELTQMQATAEPAFPDGKLVADPPARYGTAYSATVDVTFRPHESTEDPWVTTRTVGVVVRCDAYTIPRPGSDQKPGDCKVLNWWTTETTG